MAFSRVKPAGWAANEILTSTQMNALDTDHAAALDPVGGGTYNALAAPLELSGDNITLGAGTDIVTVGDGGSSTLIVNAATEFKLGVNVSAGTSTFTTAVTVNDTFTCSGNVNLGNAAGDALAVTATSTFNSPVTFASTTAHTGAATFAGNVTLGDNAAIDTVTITGSINAAVGFTGAGRVVHKTTTVATDGSISITPVTASIYYIGDSVLSGAVNWTIDDTDCVDGDWIEVISAETTHLISVRSPVPATIVQIGTIAGAPRAARVHRIGGAWVHGLMGNFA